MKCHWNCIFHAAILIVECLIWNFCLDLIISLKHDKVNNFAKNLQMLVSRTSEFCAWQRQYKEKITNQFINTLSLLFRKIDRRIRTKKLFTQITCTYVQRTKCHVILWLSITDVFDWFSLLMDRHLEFDCQTKTCITMLKYLILFVSFSFCICNLVGEPKYEEKTGNCRDFQYLGNDIVFAFENSLNGLVETIYFPNVSEIELKN